MEKDKLKDIVSKIENWSSDNDVALFYGSIDENVATEISWTQTADTDWEKYLAAAKKSNAKIIILYIATNNLDTDDQDIIDFKSDLDEEDLKDYEDSLTIVRETQGQIVYFKLNFIIDNVCYMYTQYSEWVDSYMEIFDSLPDEENEDEKEEYSSEEDELPEEEVERITQMVISNEKFLNAKDSPTRYALIRSLLDQENLVEHSPNRELVRTKIFEIYENEIKPKQEEELRLKILELKSKKVKKVEICSKLKISKTTLDKYFYSDN